MECIFSGIIRQIRIVRGDKKHEEKQIQVMVGA